jgi:diaminohydroxyphosphoribosylaminopyrimidine deaminase / 5-amino-6-(5-phosphoribosylamino)uracil reductase
MSDAVLTGIGTVLADDPLMTCRLPGMADRSPVRVVLDGKLRLRPDSRLVATARETPLWVVTGALATDEREQALRGAGAEILRVPEADDRLDLPAVLERLAERGITRLMVEAGPILAAAMVKADLADEAVLLRSPKPIGPDGIDALEGLPLAALTEAPRLELIRTEMAGEDTIEFLVRR